MGVWVGVWVGECVCWQVYVYVWVSVCVARCTYMYVQREKEVVGMRDTPSQYRQISCGERFNIFGLGSLWVDNRQIQAMICIQLNTYRNKRVTTKVPRYKQYIGVK